MRIGLLTLFAAFACAGLAAADPKKELASLNGKWRPISMHFGDTKLGPAELKNRLLTLEDGKYVFTDGRVTDIGTMTLNTKPERKTMDVKGVDGPTKGKTLLAIYEIDGDTLRICYGMDGKRPTDFRVTSDKLLLITYTKVKPQGQ